MPHPGFRFETDVTEGGTVTLKLPLPAGTRVEIVVLAPEIDDCGDLEQAASTSTDFWDNPWDDEDWNNVALTGLLSQDRFFAGEPVRPEPRELTNMD